MHANRPRGIRNPGGQPALILALFLLVVGGLLTAHGQGTTAFTYQGRLTDRGNPATGLYDLRLAVYGSETGGFTVAGPITNAPTVVSNGLFTVTLDFGGATFDGAARWLQIAVRTNGGLVAHTTLVPRQLLTPSPYALYAASAAGLDGVANAPLDIKVNGQRALRLVPSLPSQFVSDAPNLIGGSESNRVSPGSVGATIGGGGASFYQNGAQPNQVLDSWGTVGGGLDNTTDGEAATVGGGRGNRSVGQAATIGGGEANYAGAYATVGGGFGNSSGAYSATVAGGFFNFSTSLLATIGGGSDNESGELGATVGGGQYNSNFGSYGTISGGFANNIAADSPYATIPGGRMNAATNRAFAAGSRAKANHTGAFVWGDSTDADVVSTNDNSMTARASGGVRFFSDTNATAGVFLAPGGGSWSAVSDRSLKENVRPVNSGEVLRRVAALPMATWNYKSQAPATRHMGPMAQDFHTAFRIGDNDTTIATVDADGVALAAIQGLNKKLDDETQFLRDAVKARDAEIQALKEAVSQLKELISSLAKRNP